jgi:adenylate kinase
MGYLEDEVKRLHTVLSGVEGRLKALEERQFGGSSGKTAEEIRMILIGPPGAGELLVD